MSEQNNQNQQNQNMQNQEAQNLNMPNQNMQNPNPQNQNAPQSPWQAAENTYHYSYRTANPNTYQNQPYGAQQQEQRQNQQNPYQKQTVSAAKPKTKKPSGKYGFAAILIAACMVLSLGCGFGGTLLANRLSASKDNASAPVVSLEQNDTSSKEETSSEQEHIVTDADEDSSSYLPAGSTTTTTDVSDVVKKCADSVVEIVTESVSTNHMFGQYVTSGAGSGVIITEDGYIVTNNHVIEGATNIKVTLRNGTEYDAKLIAADAQSDLAVIKVEASGLSTAEFADSDALQVGQVAIAIGNPLGRLGGSVSEGILSALDREITIDDSVMTLLQTDAAINPGNSGGGLFNINGALIGIVNAKSTGAEIDGIGFAIPSNLVKSVAEQLINQGYVSGRVSIGMSLIDIDDMYTAFYYGVSRTGVYVQALTGSNAQEAGFKTGDCIIAVGDTPVSSVSEFNAAMDDYAIGDTVSLTVVRQNKQGTLSLKLVEYTGSIQ